MAEQMEKPLWMKRSNEEAEAIVLKLHEQGMSPEKIGLELRDTYGIPSLKIFSTSVSRIIKKSKKDKKIMPSDLTHLAARTKTLKKHVAHNKQDKVAKRGLQITLARVNRLTKYYKRKQAL